METHKSYLHEIFEYDENSPSSITWKVNKPPRGKKSLPAGSIDERGYWRVRFNNKRLYVHRIIWELFYGITPAYIDHIDGNPSNNNIANLRACNNSENACNRQANKNNKLGIRGIYFCKEKKAYCARVHKNGKNVFMKRFKTIEEAESAVKEARRIFHGDFFR